MFIIRFQILKRALFVTCNTGTAVQTCLWQSWQFQSYTQIWLHSFAMKMIIPHDGLVWPPEQHKHVIGSNAFSGQVCLRSPNSF